MGVRDALCWIDDDASSEPAKRTGDNTSNLLVQQRIDEIHRIGQQDFRPGSIFGSQNFDCAWERLTAGQQTWILHTICALYGRLRVRRGLAKSQYIAVPAQPDLQVIQR
ncbi:MAG: hypothetical protein QM682_11105 [Paracoccus sp. (in: a-proteobacteria)]|uniref:hypothetical protein n=1 Tax=Paracoccus sp. TaxID=267 RepID=UPI0039E21EF0